MTAFIRMARRRTLVFAVGALVGLPVLVGALAFARPEATGKPGDVGSIGLLALIAIVCLAGVATGALRTLAARRAGR